MRLSMTLAVLLSALLTGCGGSQVDSTALPASWNSAQLVYSYPDSNQHEVPRSAPVILEFSTALPSNIPAGTFIVKDAGGNSIKYSSKEVNSGKTLVITPDSKLSPHMHYTVTTAGTLKTAQGDLVLPKGGVQFDTRAATSGPASAVSEGAFTVARMIPDGSTLPLMDFSTLRLQFTQPLDHTTVQYGTDVSLKDASGALVQATVIDHGPYLTIDPTQDLTPGEKYHIVLTNGVKSTLGNTLDPGKFSDLAITPQDSSPRTVMVQHAGDSNGGSILSPLTGNPINAVPIKSVLLGDNSSSQQSGDVRAQLAFVPHYPNDTPLRINKGTLLNGSSVSVNISGQVPAGFDTGTIGVRFISDATGFLTANHYSTSPDAPRTVYLFMDLAMTTAHDKANAGLSQDLMDVELVGTSIVRNGQMVIDAVGVVNPRIQGLENASAIISFHLEAYKDQVNPPAPVADTSLPTLQSWEPGASPGSARPGDPIVLNFSEPLSRQSLDASGAVTLLGNGSAVSFDQQLDGASLIIHPQGGLKFGVNYQIQVSTQVTDLAGNPLDKTYDLSFSLPNYISGSSRSPIVTSMNPGYPCATSTVSRDLANNDEGRCLGGINNDSSDTHNATEDGSRTTLDDILPVTTLAADSPITVNFSQDMDATSIRLGSSCSDTSASFRVEEIDSSGNCLKVVPGKLTVGERSLSFSPNQPWADGQLYRYVLGSVPNSPACDGNDAICSTQKLPLQTAILEGPSAQAGGPDMEIDFRGAMDTQNVFTPLRNLPTADVNSNFSYESGEPGPTASAPDSQIENSTKLVVDRTAGTNGNGTSGSVSAANVGCDPSTGSCPEKKFTFATAALDTELVGFDKAQNAVHVKIHPTVLVTTSLDVWSNTTLGASTTPTGPQVMRLRYQKDSSGKRDQLIDGWIHSTANGPVFTTTVDAYLDAPYLTPPFSFDQNMYSYPVTLELSGPVQFLSDGRMVIGQSNATTPVSLHLHLTPTSGTLSLLSTIVSGDIYLQIPTGGVDLNYLSKPVKR